MSEARAVAQRFRADTTGGRDGGRPQGYYGRPVVKPPVWTWEIPWYFASGGTAGAGALLAAVASWRGDERLARLAGRVTAAGALASPPLLIADLGRPARFHHMLRVLKPTSPMSVGTWILTAFVPAAVGATLLRELAWLPRLRRVAEGVSALLGPAMATYTAALFADTAVPVWHEARRELPLVFAGGAAASAGAATVLVAGGVGVQPARRLAVAGAVLELGASQLMEHTLRDVPGDVDVGEPYHVGRAGRFARAAKAGTATGAALLAFLGRRRSAAIAGSALVLAGATSERWAVFEAGRQSAADPAYTIAPQRARLAHRQARDDLAQRTPSGS